MSRRFRLIRVRSPLLTESRLLSSPGGTEMFQFPPFAPYTYGFSARSFGHPGINARLTAPPGLSQSSTPFIASWRQDIPHTPLVAWPHLFRPPGLANTESQNGAPLPKAHRLLSVGSVLLLRALAKITRNPIRSVHTRTDSSPCVATLPLPNCQRTSLILQSRSRCTHLPSAATRALPATSSFLVEMTGFEPVTSWLQTTRSPS